MQINSWRVADFSSDIILAQASLGSRYIAYVISTILVTLIGYSLSKFFLEKIAKPHAEQLHADFLSF